MNQPPLFDASRTSPQTCPVRGCSAMRFPQQERTPTCRHDLEREPGRRPKGCLNEYRPEHADIGF